MENKKKKVFAYLHTHWDREWYREFEEFRLRLVEVFDDVLKKLDTAQIESFYFDGQTCALEDYLQIKPEKKEQIKKLIQKKSLFIGPYYCSTDSFLIDSESIIKNLQLGIRYSKEFGCNEFIAYHADTFGHSKFIPEIIKYFDIPTAIFWRGLGEQESEFLFRDLKSVYLIEGYFHDYFSAPVSFEMKAQMLKRTLDRIAKYSGDNLLLPVGADHLAAPENIKNQVECVNRLLDDYEIILCTPFDYLNVVQNNFKKNTNDEFRDTKRNFILPGVYSSRIDLKQMNAKLQWQISRLVQPMAAVSAYLGLTKSFQDEINYLQKELIKNHAHDSIYGCSADNVHKQNKIRFESVSEGSRAVLNSIKRDLYNENNLSVINLSKFNLYGALKIETDKKLDKKYNAQLVGMRKGFPLKKVYDIRQIPITEDYTTLYEYLVDLKDIESFSVKKIDEENIFKKSSLKITQYSIENDKIGLSIKNGTVIVTDKIKNEIYEKFLTFIDRADTGDSYNFGALEDDKPLCSEILSSRIKEKGHIRNILEITAVIFIPFKSDAKGRSKSVKKHILKLDVILENQNDYLEFNLKWENKSTDHIFQIEFNMKAPVTKTVSDDLSGYQTRNFDSEYNIYSMLPASRGIELKHNIAPFQKLLFTQGMGVITKGLQEYEVCKNKLRLTLLRATGTISNPHNPTRGTPAGPPLPTPDLQRICFNEANFALGFKKNIHCFEKDVEKFFGSSVLIQSDLKNKKLFEFGSENISLSTVKLNPGNDLIVRCVNISDEDEEIKFKTALKNKGIFITDAMENPIKKYADHTVCANSFLTLLIKS